MPNRQQVHAPALHMAIDSALHPHIAGTQPLEEPPPLVEPPPLEEPATHDALTHVPLAIVQSAQLPPALPQVALSLPAWQVPVLSQHPLGHDDGSQEPTVPPPLPLPPPVELPLLLPLELPLLLPLLPLLLPLELPLLLPLLEPDPPSPGPSPGPLVAHAKKKAPSEPKTIPPAARRPRKCILSVYLSLLPLQGVTGLGVTRRRARDCSASSIASQDRVTDRAKKTGLRGVSRSRNRLPAGVRDAPRRRARGSRAR